MSLLTLALGVVKLLNFIFGKLDADAKAKAAEALVNAANLQADLKAIHDANAARDAVVRKLRDDPDGVRVPDADARKPKARPRKGGV